MNSCEVNYLHISTAGDTFSEKSQHKIHGRDFQCLKKHRKVWLYIYTFPQNVQILIRFTLNDFPSTSWAQIRSKFITGPPILKLAGTTERKRSFHLANTLNLLLGIHLLLVKEENADRIWILLKLTHSVLTPGCQGGAPDSLFEISPKWLSVAEAVPYGNLSLS